MFPCAAEQFSRVFHDWRLLFINDVSARTHVAVGNFPVSSLASASYDNCVCSRNTVQFYELRFTSRMQAKSNYDHADM